MIVMKFSPRLAAALAAPLVLAACGGPLSGGDAEQTQVVASFYPLEYVAERIVGEHAAVTTLTSPGTEPHDLEMTVRQTAQVFDADVVVYEKGLQPAVDGAVQEHGPEAVVEVTDVITLRPADEAAHEGESGEEHEAHADAEGDLHFWLDPVAMADVAAKVADTMSEVDPDNAADYEENLTALREDLEALDQEFETGLASCERDTVVVSHDAFGYLEKYGLHFEPIAGLSPDAEPSPSHLAEMADLIREEGVTTVFSETLASPEMAETLAAEVGLETAVLDPIEGLSDETAGEDYLSLMRSNLEALKEANGCR
jgi:zinc transport system substrate-binding protein